MSNNKRLCAGAADQLRREIISLALSWHGQHGTRPHAGWIADQLDGRAAFSARTIRSCLRQLWPINLSGPPSRKEMEDRASSRRRGPRKDGSCGQPEPHPSLTAKCEDPKSSPVLVPSCNRFEDYVQRELDRHSGKPLQRARQRLLPVLRGVAFPLTQAYDIVERLPRHTFSMVHHSTDPLRTTQVLSWLQQWGFPGTVGKHIHGTYFRLWADSHRIVDEVIEETPAWLDRCIRGVVRVALASQLSESFISDHLRDDYRPVAMDVMARCTTGDGHVDTIQLMFRHEEWRGLFLATYRLMLYRLPSQQLRLGLIQTGLEVGAIPVREKDRPRSDFEQRLLRALGDRS